MHLSSSIPCRRSVCSKPSSCHLQATARSVLVVLTDLALSNLQENRQQKDLLVKPKADLLTHEKVAGLTV